MTTLVTLRPGLSLEQEAASSWARMERDRGRPLDVNRSTVDRAAQMRLYLDYEEGRSNVLALHPDRSWHCLPRARAVDTDDDAWIRNHPQYGWRFVVPSERWHAQYYPEYDQYRGQGMPAGTQEEEEMTYDEFAAYMTRFLIFEGRPKGLGATYQNGPTFHERLDRLAAADAEQSAQLATISAAVVALSKGGITEQGLREIANAARQGAEAAVEARYRAQVNALEAQLQKLREAQ